MIESGDYVRRIDPAGFARKRNFWEIIHIDPLLLLLLLILTSYGMVVLYSASDFSVDTLKRQGTFYAIAFSCIVAIAQIPMHYYRRVAPFIYLTGVFLLIMVPLFGSHAMGARRWLEIPGLPRFQPSELLKIAMPLTVAWYLTRHTLPPNLKHIAIVILLVMIPMVLIAAQPDLGTAILIGTSGFSVLLFGGILWRYVMAAIALLVAAAWPMWQFVLHDYQKNRILTLLNPEMDKFGTGWNIIQSKTAIGSGGWDGKGWLEGSQSHLSFLPESHTDFIIAVLSEEFGFKGVLFLLTIYFFIVLRGLAIAWNATSNFNQLVAGSISLTFFVYIFVNMGMVSGVLPIVGVPLPLVSQGGTSVITLMSGFGLLMAIASEKKQFTREA